MILDRHVFGEWLRVFLLSLGVTLGLLLLADVYDNLPELLNLGVGLGGIARYYATALPTFLPLVLPIALLLSLLFSLSNLHRFGEITAMRAAGLSIGRITRSLWLAALLLAGFTFYLQAVWVPSAAVRTVELRESFEFSQELADRGDAREVGVVRNLSYASVDGRQLWFLERYSRFREEAAGVMIAERDRAGRERRRLLAEEAVWDADAGAWTLRRGRVMQLDPATGNLLSAEPFAEQQFASLVKDPQIMLLREKRVRDLSLFELEILLNDLKGSDHPRLTAYRTRYYSLLASALTCLVATALAIPFALSGVRVNPMVGVSKSLGLFFLYFLLLTLAGLAGSWRLLSPAMAAFLPHIVMLTIALHFYRRLR